MADANVGKAELTPEQYFEKGIARGLAMAAGAVPMYRERILALAYSASKLEAAAPPSAELVSADLQYIKRIIDGWVEDEHGLVHVHKDVITKAVAAAIYNQRAAPPAKEVREALDKSDRHFESDYDQGFRNAITEAVEAIESIPFSPERSSWVDVRERVKALIALAAPPAPSVPSPRLSADDVTEIFGPVLFPGRVADQLNKRLAGRAATSPTETGYVKRELLDDIQNQWWDAIASYDPTCDVTLVGDIKQYVHIVMDKIRQKAWVESKLITENEENKKLSTLSGRHVEHLPKEEPEPFIIFKELPHKGEWESMKSYTQRICTGLVGSISRGDFIIPLTWSVLLKYKSKGATVIGPWTEVLSNSSQHFKEKVASYLNNLEEIKLS